MRAVRSCLESGSVRWGRHFAEELANDGLAIQDALHVLTVGFVYNPPEPDIRTGEWKYRIEGDNLDGVRLAVVFCFKSSESAFLVTIFAISPGRK